MIFDLGIINFVNLYIIFNFKKRIDDFIYYFQKYRDVRFILKYERYKKIFIFLSKVLNL